MEVITRDCKKDGKPMTAVFSVYDASSQENAEKLVNRFLKTAKNVGERRKFSSGELVVFVRIRTAR